LLLPGGECPGVAAPDQTPFLTKSLMGIMAPHFNPEGTQVFFIADAWTTSGAIFVIDLKTSDVRFFTDGNHFAIVEAGPHRGYLVVSKHRYWQFEAGYDPTDLAAPFGSYDHYWLVSPEAQTIRDLGDDLMAALAKLSGEEEPKLT
jgi:hypothetical protein